MKKTVIVTGGNGYIGSHMCKFLHSQGYDVHVIDNFSSSPASAVHSYGTFHRMDIADQEIEKLFKELNPHCVFHFAAKALVEESQKSPLLYYTENVTKTIRLLDYCTKSSVKKFVFSSTCATFGNFSGPISETTPQNPINTYGITKLMIERCLRDMCEKNLIDAVVFRYFNATGASPEGDLGENHEPETHAIPNICKSVLSQNLKPFFVYGNSYPTKDGTCVRDYIDVNDLARAHYIGMQFIEKVNGFHDFNLGSGVGTSVLELIHSLGNALNVNVSYNFEAPREGDPPILVANATKARNVLNFSPEFTLETSIKNLYYYLKNKASS